MTQISIAGRDFLIDGELTYKGRQWRGHRIEGLLMNSRMVQATFDDTNPDTVGRWAYPDTGQWDAERNVRELLETMPIYREHGLLAMTINLQGGSPQGYSKDQPWINTAFEADGRLKPAYMHSTSPSITSWPLSAPGHRGAILIQARATIGMAISARPSTGGFRPIASVTFSPC